MKKIIVMVLSVLMMLSFTACAAKAIDLETVKDSLGKLTYNDAEFGEDELLAGTMTMSGDDLKTYLATLNLSDTVVDIQGSLAYVPMLINCDTVFVLKATSGNKQAVKDAMNKYQADKIELHTWYVSNQLPTAEGAEIYENGDYVILVMTKDNAAVKTAIKNS